MLQTDAGFVDTSRKEIARERVCYYGSDYHDDYDNDYYYGYMKARQTTAKGPIPLTNKTGLSVWAKIGKLKQRVLDGA